MSPIDCTCIAQEREFLQADESPQEQNWPVVEVSWDRVFRLESSWSTVDVKLLNTMWSTWSEGLKQSRHRMLSVLIAQSLHPYTISPDRNIWLQTVPDAAIVYSLSSGGSGPSVVIQGCRKHSPTVILFSLSTVNIRSIRARGVSLRQSQYGEGYSNLAFWICSTRLYGCSGLLSSSLKGGNPQRQMYRTTPRL